MLSKEDFNAALARMANVAKDQPTLLEEYMKDIEALRTDFEERDKHISDFEKERERFAEYDNKYNALETEYKSLKQKYVDRFFGKIPATEEEEESPETGDKGEDPEEITFEDIVVKKED